MTVKIGDVFLYNNELFYIIAYSDKMKFNIKDFGIEYESGYDLTEHIQKFLITAEGLFLYELKFNTHQGCFPKINNVEPKKITVAKKFLYDGKEETHHFKQTIYSDLMLAVDYTGSIIMGQGINYLYFNNTGYQFAHAYDKVFQVYFYQNKPSGIIDRSKQMGYIREAIKPYMGKQRNYKLMRKGLRAIICPTVLQTFSLDFQDKWDIYKKKYPEIMLRECQLQAVK